MIDQALLRAGRACATAVKSVHAAGVATFAVIPDQGQINLSKSRRDRSLFVLASCPARLQIVAAELIKDWADLSAHLHLSHQRLRSGSGLVSSDTRTMF